MNHYYSDLSISKHNYDSPGALVAHLAENESSTSLHLSMGQNASKQTVGGGVDFQIKKELFSILGSLLAYIRMNRNKIFYFY